MYTIATFLVILVRVRMIIGFIEILQPVTRSKDYTVMHRSKITTEHNMSSQFVTVILALTR
jgi:hypothetical protein